MKYGLKLFYTKGYGGNVFIPADNMSDKWGVKIGDTLNYGNKEIPIYSLDTPHTDLYRRIFTMPSIEMVYGSPSEIKESLMRIFNPTYYPVICKVKYEPLSKFIYGHHRYANEYKLVKVKERITSEKLISEYREYMTQKRHLELLAKLGISNAVKHGYEVCYG
jgi:hypothetical protein